MKQYKNYIITALIVLVAVAGGWYISERNKIGVFCPRCNYDIAIDVPYIQYKWFWNIEKCPECGFVLPVDGNSFDYEQYLEDREHYDFHTVESDGMIYIYDRDNNLVDSVSVDETCPD